MTEVSEARLATSATSATSATRAPRARRASTASVLATIGAVAPRAVYTYPAYVLSPLMLIDWRRTKPIVFAKLVLLLLCATLGLLLSGLVQDVSWTSAAMELGFMLPLLLFACGFAVRHDVGIQTIRLVNVVLLVGNLINIARNGIPYLQSIPDIVSGFYGLGGARVVTVLGFFAVLTEYLLQRRAGPTSPYQASRAMLVIGLFNFFVPSYILGILAGAGALAFLLSKSPGRFLVLAAVAMPSIWYAYEFRFSTATRMAAQITGQDPKVYAYSAIGRLFADHPELALFGTGPGQFSSTPQTYVDPGVREVAGNAIPDVPGLFMTQLHASYIGSYTSIGIDHPFAISSSINKPYTGVTTMLAEWGLVGVLLLLMTFFVSRGLARLDSAAWGGYLFLALLCAVDLWHDSTWIALGLLCLRGALIDVLGEPDGSEPRGPAVRSRGTRARAPVRRGTDPVWSTSRRVGETSPRR